MPGRARNYNFSDRKFLCDRCGVQRTAAAIRNQSEVARVQAALERHVTHCISHCRGGHLKHACGRTFEIYIERLGQSIAQCGYGGVAIEAHLAAEKTLRRKPSENHIRVSDRRLRSSAPITRRARLRAGAARTDVASAALHTPSN